MQIGHWIALAIVAVAIIAFIVVGIQAKKKVAPTIDIFKKFKQNIDTQANHFKSESQHIQTEMNLLSERGKSLQSNALDKQKKLTHFMESQQELQNQITYLKEVGTKYAKDSGQALVEDIKRDVPKISKIMKLAIQKTIRKQKARQIKEGGN